DALNYPSLKGVQTLVILSKKSWYEANLDVAVGWAKAWAEITKWIYDPKNKDEVIQILVRTGKVEQQPAANAYDYWVGKGKLYPTDLKVDLKMAQQMAENQKKIGMENVPTEVTRY